MEFETGHTDVVNALELDYYGRRVVTASSDQTLRVFDVASGEPTLLAELQGHTGPVWDVAWAHPKYGSLLASCAFDNSVIIWKETETGWAQSYRSGPSAHVASVNGVAWASHDAGLLLASAGSDGAVCVFECQADGTWTEHRVPAVDSVSCTSISWAPTGISASLSSEGEGPAALRFVVGGCDNSLKVMAKTNGTWRIEKQLNGHQDWVLDVAWAPNTTATHHVIASAGKDGKLIVWKEKPTGAWELNLVHTFPAAVHGVRWSETGNLLSVFDANQGETIWKENTATGKWSQLPQ